MANNIELAGKFLPIIDGIYKENSVTNVLDTPTLDFGGVNEVKVLKVSTTGLGDYSRSNGYPKGDVTATWETMKLTEERGKEISIDRMENEETLGMTFGAVTNNFMTEQVIPELDAYRFAKYASSSNILTTDGAALTKDSVISAIDEAVKEMDGNEVPTEGRILFVNSDLKISLNQALSRKWGSDSTVNTVLDGYNGMKIIYVPRTRFYTQIDLNDGSENWGFAKSSGGAAINFMIVHPSAVVQVKKFMLPKIFDPDTNQEKDAWKFQFRLYHDAFAYENKAKGIYLHKATV
jgi:hypothetical protein